MRRKTRRQDSPCSLNSGAIVTAGERAASEALTVAVLLKLGPAAPPPSAGREGTGGAADWCDEYTSSAKSMSRWAHSADGRDSSSCLRRSAHASHTA